MTSTSVDLTNRSSGGLGSPRRLPLSTVVSLGNGHGTGTRERVVF
jgi:hypothetical protein